MLLAQIIVYTVSAYLALGFIFAVYFAFFAVQKFDEAARGAGIGFRVIIFFGVIPFWVLLLKRILGGGKHPLELTAHRKNIGGEIK